MPRHQLSETEIRTQYITPALVKAGWDFKRNAREELYLTDGRILVKGKHTKRGKRKKADYVLFHKPGVPLAIVEAKDNTHAVGDGMQQALEYGEMLDVPFVFSSNGDAFLEHDRTGKSKPIEREISLDSFPSPQALWERFTAVKDLKDSELQTIYTQDYHDDGSGKAPRYYQLAAINRTIEAIARGQNRILLVMATGTGKTYTAFQIIWRLWKARKKRRILLLVDRNALADQTRIQDFKPFGEAMTKVTDRRVDKAYEIYLALYQAVSGTEEWQNIYKQFSREFFDLVVVDECHRGSADEASAWHEILDYFDSATHIGMAATPKETKDVSNLAYFGDPVYTYSLKQGIEDGFLAPYKVVRIDLDKDLEGWRPTYGQVDDRGELIEDRIYNQQDFDRSLVLAERTKRVAERVTQFLKETDRDSKSIIFCEDTEHAGRMRNELVKLNGDITATDRRYVMRITGNDPEGKAELDNFIDRESLRPTIACTSRLLTTGVDTKTVRLIVLDRQIKSLTEFKQI
ncbi:MAG: DEAD/DEAH box helicase family protein, partial [Candidatus Marinimicrobia bacterium]|nr:DEAD/DEAH box helicase family protein [Candidatus Neomarinimicrobiota bacterium]